MISTETPALGRAIVAVFAGSLVNTIAVHAVEFTPFSTGTG